MFTHSDYKKRGLNMPYYKAFEAGYITYEEYKELKNLQQQKSDNQKRETNSEFYEYSREELDEMYRGAYEDEEGAYWNTD